MKNKITLLMLMTFLFIGVSAQTPEKINYQAVARDLSGNPLASQAIAVIIEVRQGSASGADVYKESHSVTTNAFGLFTLEIGGGTLLGGNFSTISWGTNSYYLYIEVDGNPIGASQLLSVPYALYSKNGPTGAQGPPGVGINWLGTLVSAPTTPNLNDAYYNSTTGQSFIWDGATWQILAQDGTAGSLTGGPGISVLANVISNTGDLDSTNELQNLSITGNTINITQGTGANISATPPSTGDYLYWNGLNWVPQSVPANTDNQNLSNGGKIGNNQTINIQNGTGVVFSVADGDSLSTNEIQQLTFANPNLSLSNGGGTVNLSSLSGPTYTAGTGISIASNIITNTLPDQTVSITGAGATSVSGTYPNFTITSTDNVNDADFNPSNEYNTNFAVNGANLEITDGGGTRQVAMSSFADNDWIPNGIAIRNGNAGNVGIGVFVPTRKLHVEDNSTAFATYIQQSNTSGDGLSVYSNTSVSARTIFSAVGNSSGLYVKGNSDVGIGTATPNSKLHVANGHITMQDGNQQIGRIPVSNASGLMTWTDPSTIPLGNAWLVNGVNIYNGNTGNVGIGTTSPSAKFQVQSNAWVQMLVRTNSNGTVGTGVTMSKSRGSEITPSAVLSGDRFGDVVFEGYDGTNYEAGAWIRGTASENWSASGRGTDLFFTTAANGSTTYQTRMTILNSGNVGIGTSNPVNKLDVEGGMAVGTTYSGNIVAPTNGLIVEGNVGIGVTAPTSKLEVTTNLSNNYVARITNNNTTNGGTHGMLVSLGVSSPSSSNYYIAMSWGGFIRGTITGNSGTGVLYNTTSDKRLKENISEFNALSLIEKIEPKLYNFIGYDKKEHGFLAQDLQLVYPEAVKGDPNSDPTKDPMMVDYSKLTPLLTGGIKELYKLIQEQQKMIEELKKEVEELKSK